MLNRFAVIGASLLLAASTLTAQTTGVVGVNNLIMLLPPTYVPAGGGTVSCSTFVTTGAVGVNPIGFMLDSPSASATFLLISPLGCIPAFFPFTPSATAACAGPAAGTPLTNLWLSLGVGGPFPIIVAGQINSAGFTRWNFNLGWPIVPLHVQGLMLDTCSPTGFKFSQAMGFQ